MSYSKRLKSNFPFLPTSGQENLFDLLADFIFGLHGNNVLILKGFAGTGKTSVVAAVVKTLQLINAPLVLMAPTGRAAKVLGSYSKHHTSTIHRRIYFAVRNSSGSLVMKLQQNKIKRGVYIVDEASMLPDSRADEQGGGRILLDDLMEFVFTGENSRLILVGDTAQLPPVGLQISPALDLQYLKNKYHYGIVEFELKEVVRQAYDSGILFNATEIRNAIAAGNFMFPLLHSFGFKDVKRIDANELKDEIESAYSFKGQDNTTIITRSNKRANGYNMQIRNRILYRENELDGGDLLMVVKNNYFWLDETSAAGFMANGDLVEVLGVANFEEKFGFRFANIDIRLVDYPEMPGLRVKILLDTLTVDGPALSFEENNKLFNEVLVSYDECKTRREKVEKVKVDPYFNALQVKFAYALTCHKTQGGQWDTIFIDQGYITADKVDSDYFRWLYTAITRATNKVFLVSFADEIFVE